MRNLPQPAAVRFQVSAQIHKPKGVEITSEFLAIAFLAWLDGKEVKGITFRVIIWTGRKQRELTEIGTDHRGEVLKETLRRALQAGRLHIAPVGENQ